MNQKLSLLLCFLIGVCATLAVVLALQLTAPRAGRTITAPPSLVAPTPTPAVEYNQPPVRYDMFNRRIPTKPMSEWEQVWVGGVRVR